MPGRASFRKAGGRKERRPALGAPVSLSTLASGGGARVDATERLKTASYLPPIALDHSANIRIGIPANYAATVNDRA